MSDANSNRLGDHFANQDPSTHPQKWDELWGDNYTPWDRGVASPALKDLLTTREDILPAISGRKKALVPGCGRGYDVLLLSSFGYDTYGLDFSSKALEAAKKTESEVDEKGEYTAREGVEKGKITWVAGDFFKDEWMASVEGERLFDLIYDYTFLSALPPALRPAWSKRLQELLAPGGRIVCLEWPTHKPVSSGGPPWPLPPNVYLAHLSQPGKVLLYKDSGDLLEAEIGKPDQSGLQRIAHFHPASTHKAGYNADGTMNDWIGVWTHPSPQSV